MGYDGRSILPAIDFSIHPGENWVIVGRNGAGKSTLLKTLMGLIAPVAGRVSRPAGGDLAYVPQRHRLDPLVPMRALDLVAEGLEARWSFLRPLRPPGARARVWQALARTQVEHLAYLRFSELSEGQKQRVLLARAVVSNPALIVLDEPTSAMDLLAERQTLEILDGLRQAHGTAVLLVSHHISAAMALADRALFLDADHQVVAAGPIDEVMAQPLFRHHFGGLVDLPELGGAP